VIQRQSLLIATDNTTVVAYLQNQGGTHSSRGFRGTPVKRLDLCNNNWRWGSSLKNRNTSLPYLSNWMPELLQVQLNWQFLLRDRTHFVIGLLLKLGFLISWKKSELVPSQDFIFLGEHYQTDLGLVFPSFRYHWIGRICRWPRGITSIREIRKPIGCKNWWVSYW
jgi:hypothetical protein